MTEQHPITPPPELVEQWANDSVPMKANAIAKDWEIAFASRAAQWGADQELEACCQALYSRYVNTGLLPATAETVSQEMRDWLLAARRPKPSSLKELALDALQNMDHMNQFPNKYDYNTIRCALETLDD